MPSFLQDFLREAPSPSGRGLCMAVFGKHPGWRDHMDPINLSTPGLTTAYQLLYEEGLGGRGGPISSGAWEALAPEERVPRFDHILAWVRADQFILGRLWASSDCARPPRSLYPMIACVHAWGLPLNEAMTGIPARLDALPRLGRIQNEKEINDVVHRVWSDEQFAEELRAQLRDAVKQVQQSLDVWRQNTSAPAAGPVLQPSERERFLDAAALGPEREGLRRVLYQIEAKFSAYSNVNAQARGDDSDLRPQQIRVPTDGNAPRGMLFWIDFLRALMPLDIPILLTAPMSGLWLDITVGEPSPDQLASLRLAPGALPPASCIPFELTPDVRERSDAIIEAFRRGETPAAPRAAPPASNRRKVPSPSTPPSEKPALSKDRSRSPLLKALLGGAVVSLAGLGAWHAFVPPAPPNRAPVAESQSARVIAGGSVSITLRAADPEGSFLKYRMVSLPAQGTLLGNPPNVTYDASPTASGVDRLSFVASDGKKESPPAEVIFEIVAPRPPPMAMAQNVSVAAGESIKIALSGSDSEGASLTYTIETPPQQGALTGTPPQLVYQPNSEATGADRFSFRVGNGRQDSASAEVTIDIAAPAPPPVAMPQQLRVAAGEAVPIVLTAADPADLPLQYSLISRPRHGDLEGEPPRLNYRSRPEARGADEFSFKVSNGKKDSAPAEILITVEPPNLAPAASNQVLIVESGTSVSFELTGADPENAPLTYRIVELPRHGTLSGKAPNLRYHANPKGADTDAFTFLVNDGALDSSPGTVTIRIRPPANQPPVASSQTLTVHAGEPLKITLTGRDPENASLSYTVLDPPSQGTLSGAAPSLTYQPGTDARGLDRFSFTVSDGAQESPPAEVTLEIRETATAPVDSSDGAKTVETARLSREDLDQQLATLESVYQKWRGQRFWSDGVYAFFASQLPAVEKAYQQAGWLNEATRKRIESMKRDPKVRAALDRKE